MSPRIKLAVSCLLLSVAACLCQPASANADETHNLIVRNHTETAYYIDSGTVGSQGSRSTVNRLGVLGANVSKLWKIYEPSKVIYVKATDSAGNVKEGWPVLRSNGIYIWDIN